MTDEALFDLTGYSNSQTEREWFPQGTGGNPFFLKEMSIPQGKIMIWVGLIGKYRITFVNTHTHTFIFRNKISKGFDISHYTRPKVPNRGATTLGCRKLVSVVPPIVTIP